MPAAVLKRYRKAFLPVGSESEAALLKVSDGGHIRVEWRRVRSPEQHDMWWGVVRTAFENQDGYASIEDFASAVLCAIGHCEPSMDGTRLIAKSISFGNVPQDEFNTIHQATLKLLAERMGITPETLSAEAGLPSYIADGARNLEGG